MTVKQQNKNYVIFDLDGTITDPKAGITKSAAYALEGLGYGQTDPDTLDWFIGPPLHKSFMDYTGCSHEKALELIEKYRERYRSTGVHENILYGGVREMLAGLKNAGIVLAIASSKPLVFVRQILEDFNIENYFTVVEGSDLAGKHVEKEDVLSSAIASLEKLDGKPDGLHISERTVMVGDRCFDITAAHNFGLKAIGVSYGYARKGELQEAKADFIAESPAEVLELVSAIYT